MTASVDDLLRQLGNPGRFQIIVFGLLCFNYVPLALNNLIFAFINWTPSFRCKGDYEIDNDTYNSSCISAQGDEEKGCTEGFDFAVDQGEITVISEWELVCDRRYLSSLITSLYYVGVMLGGVVFGSLSDKYGRRKTMITCAVSEGLLAVAIACNTNLPTLIVFKITQGFFVQGLQCTTYTIAMEMFLPNLRAVAGTMLEIFWALGIITLGTAAYLFPNWRHLHLFVGFFSICLVVVIWYVPESLRWLISTGRNQEALKLAESIRKFNNITDVYENVEDEIARIQEALEGENESGYTLKDLFRTPIMRYNTIALSFTWFSIAASYYGITLAIPNMIGNKHLNFVISGVAEIIAYSITLVILKKLGRNIVLTFYLVTTGVLFMIIFIFLLVFADGHLNPNFYWVTIIAMIGKTTVVSAFCVIFIYTSELYPTVVRSMGLGFCLFWTRFGGVIAPQILMLSSYLSENSLFIIFGALTLASGVVVYGLPETMGNSLPDTICDVELLAMSKSELHKSFMQEIELSDEDDNVPLTTRSYSPHCSTKSRKQSLIANVENKLLETVEESRSLEEEEEEEEDSRSHYTTLRLVINNETLKSKQKLENES